METVEHLLSCQNKLGEGPLWHIEEQALYWVDIYRKQVLRYHSRSGHQDLFQLETAITALGRREAGGFIAATSRGFESWSPGGELQLFYPLEAGRPHFRCNDGAVDPQGRFWAGTLCDDPAGEASSPGALYRLDPGGEVHCMETGVLVSNGLGWSPDGGTMYYTDSLRKVIYAYDFDPSSGSIQNRRDFISTPDEPGVPDGLAVDSQGFIWSARWGGWKIQRYDPTGRLEREIPMPVEFPTSCAFGGDDLRALYITSAWKQIPADRRKDFPLAGDLFRLHTEVLGQTASMSL